MGEFTEIHDLLRGDFAAIRNRLDTAQTWRALTDAQRDAVESARRRAALGLSRLDALNPPAPPAPSVERPYPEHPVYRPIPADVRDWEGSGAASIAASLALDTGAESPTVWQAGAGVQWTLVIVGREVLVWAPADITPGTGSDHALVLIDLAAGLEYRMWRAVISGRRITCELGNIIELGTHQVIHGGRPTGSGMSYTVGLVWPREMREGIDHAMRISAPDIGAAHVLPALHSDQRGECPPRLPMGARLYLPRSVELAPIVERISARLPDPLAQRAAANIVRATQDYGMVLADGTQGPRTIYLAGEPSVDWSLAMGPATGMWNGRRTWNGIARAISAELPWGAFRVTDDPRLGS